MRLKTFIFNLNIQYFGLLCPYIYTGTLQIVKQLNKIKNIQFQFKTNIFWFEDPPYVRTGALQIVKQLNEIKNIYIQFKTNTF